MQVAVHLFSILRDCLPAGSKGGQAAIDLPEGATLVDLVAHLGIDRRLGYPAAEVMARAGWQVMVSGAFEGDPDRILQEGDRVQIFPPVAGG